MAEMAGPVDVRCDCCEGPDAPVWVFRVHEFTVGFEGVPEMWKHYPENDPWAVCAQCKIDVLADNQDAILKRRRNSASLWVAGSMSRQTFATYVRFIDIITMGFLSARIKHQPGEPFSVLDYADALVKVKNAGGRM